MLPLAETFPHLQFVVQDLSKVIKEDAVEVCLPLAFSYPLDMLKRSFPAKY
jgi:hypothetical protein